MADSKNLKVTMSADTSRFQQGMKGAKSALRDFDKTSQNALTSLGSALGVDTGKIQQLTGSVKGLGVQLSSMGNAGTAAFGKMLAGISGMSTALASVGLGAAIASFKLLHGEAEAFKNTIEGANIELMTQAYVSTYRQAMHDFNSDIGLSVAEFESQWKEGWARITANMKSTLVKTITGVWSNLGDLSLSGVIGGIGGGIGGAAAGVAANIATRLGFAASETNKESDEALAKAERAKKIAGELYDLKVQESQQQIAIAQINSWIAEAMEKASDRTKSDAERYEAIKSAQTLIAEKYMLQRDLQSQIVERTEEAVGLANSTEEEVFALNELKARTIALEGQEAQEMRATMRIGTTLAMSAQAEAEARQKAAAAAKEQKQALADSRSSLAEWGTMASDTSGLNAVSELATTSALSPTITPKLDEPAAKQVVYDLSNLVTSGITEMSSAIGSLVGDLVTGGDAWSNFGAAAGAALGDMAISVGKIAVSTGVATLGIKAALESLNGYVAIAAGAALIMLGSMVKTSLGNIAGGNYSAASTVSSGSYTSSSSLGTLSASTMNIKITGKLVGSGSDLVAVINQEEFRRNHTT